MTIAQLALAAILLPCAAQAALAPQYQRAAELNQIIASNAVQSALQDQPINSVMMTATDRFEVTSDSCTAIVVVFDVPVDGERPPGPRLFDVAVDSVDCR